jgi:hypothetical protein
VGRLGLRLRSSKMEMIDVWKITRKQIMADVHVFQIRMEKSFLIPS